MKSLPHSRYFRTDEMCWRDLNKINILIKNVFLWLFFSAMWSGVMNWLYEDLGPGNFLLQNNGIWDICLRKPLWAREQCSRLKDKKWDFLLALGHQTTWVIFFFLVKSNSTLREDSWESLGLQGDPPVHPEEDQSWVFIGRTDVEAETPILWPPHAKRWLIGKDPDAGRDWGQEEKGTTEDEMAGWHHRLDGHEFE